MINDDTKKKNISKAKGHWRENETPAFVLVVQLSSSYIFAISEQQNQAYRGTSGRVIKTTKFTGWDWKLPARNICNSVSFSFPSQNNETISTCYPEEANIMQGRGTPGLNLLGRKAENAVVTTGNEPGPRAPGLIIGRKRSHCSHSDLPSVCCIHRAVVKYWVAPLCGPQLPLQRRQVCYFPISDQKRRNR